MKNQWIFIDESGKPEVYSAKGVNLVEANQASKYLVLAAVRSSDQLSLQQQITKFRLSLLNKLNLDVKIDVLVIEKLKTYEALKFKPGKMYGVMSGQLIKNLCHQFENTEIIFSRKDSKLRLRQELQSEVETVRLNYLDTHPKLKPNLKLSYFHNPHYSHGGLQVADYIAYAVFQVFENKNDKWYSIVKEKIGKIQDICNKKYFTRSNPLQLSI